MKEWGFEMTLLYCVEFTYWEAGNDCNRTSAQPWLVELADSYFVLTALLGLSHISPNSIKPTGHSRHSTFANMTAPLHVFWTTHSSYIYVASSFKYFIKVKPKSCWMLELSCLEKQINEKENKIKIYKATVGLERGPPSLVRTIG